MTIKSYKLTEGTALLGTAPLDISAQLTKCVVNASENVTSTDAVPVLSGEELAAEEDVDYSYTFEATLLQDLDVAGVIEWSWNNKGTWQDIVVIPSNAADRGIVGQVRPIPISIGGDVKSRPTSDITWALRGPDGDPDPIFGVADPVEGTVVEDV